MPRSSGSARLDADPVDRDGEEPLEGDVGIEVPRAELQAAQGLEPPGLAIGFEGLHEAGGYRLAARDLLPIASLLVHESDDVVHHEGMGESGSAGLEAEVHEDTRGVLDALEVR